MPKLADSGSNSDSRLNFRPCTQILPPNKVQVFQSFKYCQIQFVNLLAFCLAKCLFFHLCYYAFSNGEKDTSFFTALQRWAAASRFVSGSLACLHYYENENQVKKKGSIDLKNCLEVRDRLESTFYRHLFSLHTNVRTYYLAAESEIEMNSWVDQLIQALGLNVGGLYAAKVFVAVVC